MWTEIHQQLASSAPHQRRVGWRQLHQLITQHHVWPTPEQLQFLQQALWDETDAEVSQVAMKVLLIASLERHAEEALARQEALPITGLREPLAHWLWRPFQDESLVFRVTDQRAMLRDEDAAIELARCLPHRDFPSVQFPPVTLGNPQWDEILDHRNPTALCFVGRLGLYGDEALQMWGGKPRRFRFLQHDRPMGLEPRSLDPKYHCIAEYQGGREVARCQTRDTNDQRRDFGIVQRYRVTYRARKIVVVVCAGATSLGTLGAVLWAANQLQRDVQSEDLIPMPERSTLDSCMEALLEVTAACTRTLPTWRHPQLQLCRLFVDDMSWSQQNQEWSLPSPKEIRLLHEKNRRDRVTAILFDGEKARVQNGSQRFKLLVEVCRLAQKSPHQQVPIARLVDHHSIWTAPTDEKEVRGHLSQLKHRLLRDALFIQDDIIRLEAQVVFVEKPGD